MKNKIFNYKINKKENEIDYYYNIRKIFIENLKPKNNKEFKLYEMYSNIFINILFLKCRYLQDTEKNIKKLIKKINLKNILLENNVKINNI
jgi:hypothetical protein